MDAMSTLHENKLIYTDGVIVDRTMYKYNVSQLKTLKPIESKELKEVMVSYVDLYNIDIPFCINPTVFWSLFEYNNMHMLSAFIKVRCNASM